MPHPAVQILVWITLAIAAQVLPAVGLALMTVLLFISAVKLNARQLFSLIRRTRWILFSLLLIYAYTTPGAALVSEFGLYSPTKEGLMDGLLQLARLLSMLSGLAILLSLLTQAQFISGIFALALPVTWFGMSRERIAVRLALTLQYAEPTMREAADDWKHAIKNALSSAQEAEQHLILDRNSLKAVDVICLLLCAALLYGVWK